MLPTTPGFQDFSSSDSSSDEDDNEQQQQGSAMSNPKFPQPASTDESESDPTKSPENPLPLRQPSRSADPSNTIKPIASKPMNETPTSKSSKFKPKRPTLKTLRMKRKIIEEEDDIAGGGPSEKKISQRVWSEEDEIALLKGMLEYRIKNGSCPSTPADFDFFHGFVQLSLQNEYTRTQVYDKVRRLRMKYSNSSGRSKKGDIQCSSHERTLYQLYKNIWGSKKPTVENGNGNKEEVDTTKVATLTSSKKSRNDVESPAIAGGAKGAGNEEILYPILNEIVTQMEIEHANSSMRGAFRRTLKSLKPSERKELEKKWARQCAAEMQLCMRREELKKELIGKFNGVLNNGS